MKCSYVILLLSYFGQYSVSSWPAANAELGNHVKDDRKQLIIPIQYRPSKDILRACQGRLYVLRTSSEHPLEVLCCLVPCPYVRLQNGKTRIRARGRIMRFDCYNGFILVGNKYASCIHGKWDTPVPLCVGTRCTPPENPAHTFVASKLGGGILMFFCEPGYSLVGSSEIYCNGRNWNTTIPSCQDSNASAPTKCDFESPDLCLWEQDPRHDFDWRRHNFGTPSLHIGTGPTHDHTLGVGNDGHYLYTEASGQRVNDTARIISPLYNSSLTDSGCFSFWYHMYGATIGTINIYYRQETNDTRLLMFSKEGNQGNRWLQGVFELPKSNVSFQIIIEGIRGSTYVSDIAIDDLAILQGDECIVKNNFTNVTESNDDQVEIVNAQQTCRDRCVYSMTEITTTSKFGLETCHCTLDCAERSICCPDYEEYCPAVFTDLVTTTPHETKAIYINPKDYIDPNASNSSSTTMRKPNVTMTTPIWRTTTRLPKQTTTSSARRNQTEARETPFAPKTTTGYIELQDRPEMHSEEQNPEKVKDDSTFEHVILGISTSAILILFLLTLGITIVVIRRKKTYKRGRSSGLSEDSDVRFLTSDEILDFNLARPAESEEQ